MKRRPIDIVSAAILKHAPAMWENVEANNAMIARGIKAGTIRLPTPTQNDLILAHLKAGRVIEGWTAWKRFGCARLAARVYDLKHQGHDIRTRMITTSTGKRIGLYYLAP